MSNSIDAVRHRIKRLKELGEDFVMKLGEIDCAFMLEQYDQLKQENEVLKASLKESVVVLEKYKEMVYEYNSNISPEQSFAAKTLLKKLYLKYPELNKEGAE